MAARYRMDAAIRQYLLAVPGVAALMGTRAFPETGPINITAPFLTLTCDSSESNKSLNGGELKSREAVYQVAVEARTSKIAGQIVGLMTARKQDGGIGGFRGTMGTGDNAAYVQYAFVGEVRDEAEQPATAENDQRYTASFDLRIKFNT
ncbi:hypothetical protein [Zavarzinella formosa]|uniref:hypothetical protein n=1 Tax=Zavarzinella formosa TaxID=360055 RepID=UPI00038056B6|nr:hypothetical protein [Zavarzinella formosa]